MRIGFLFFTLLSIFAEARYCTFLPPSGWEIAHLKIPSPYVKIGFVGQGSTEFRPSINLSMESVDVPLKEYVKAVKKLQLADPTVKWRDLGPFSMRGGVGRLIEMSTTSPWGEVKKFQAFFIADETAYILTSSVLKKDLPKWQAQLLQSFRSLALVDDLWFSIEDPGQQKAFQDFFSSLGGSEDKDQQWEQLQAQVETFSHLGPYWQFLALQEGRAKIYKAK